MEPHIGAIVWCAHDWKDVDSSIDRRFPLIAVTMNDQRCHRRAMVPGGPQTLFVEIMRIINHHPPFQELM